MHAILFIQALLGHLIGDYWLQNDIMAKLKSERGVKGAFVCTIHVLLYTAAVMFMMGITSWKLALLIATSHWIIDRFSLAAIFMELKNGVYPWKLWQLGEVRKTEPFAPGTEVTSAGLNGLFVEEKAIEKTWHIAFTAPVYIVTDNTAHLLCLWGMIRWLM